MNRIVHFMILKDKKIRYWCNQAVNVTDGKYTNDYFKVTCKKCKRELDKYNPKLNKCVIREVTEGEQK